MRTLIYSIQRVNTQQSVMHHSYHQLSYGKRRILLYPLHVLLLRFLGTRTATAARYGRCFNPMSRPHSFIQDIRNMKYKFSKDNYSNNKCSTKDIPVHDRNSCKLI